MGVGKIAVERDGDKSSLLLDSDIDPQDVSDGYHTAINDKAVLRPLAPPY